MRLVFSLSRMWRAVLEILATAGQFVFDDDGNWKFLSTGAWKWFDASGECGDCCGGCTSNCDPDPTICMQILWTGTDTARDRFGSASWGNGEFKPICPTFYSADTGSVYEYFYEAGPVGGGNIMLRATTSQMYMKLIFSPNTYTLKYAAGAHSTGDFTVHNGVSTASGLGMTSGNFPQTTLGDVFFGQVTWVNIGETWVWTKEGSNWK